jgi:hypothetical protein
MEMANIVSSVLYILKFWSYLLLVESVHIRMSDYLKNISLYFVNLCQLQVSLIFNL